MNRSLRSGLIALSAAAVMATAPSVSQAQITRQISYQGLLTTTAGLPITDGNYGLVLRLYDAPTGGNLVWEETQQTTVVKGLFNVYLGSVVPLTGVDFFNTQLYLETAIQGQPPFPRTRLAVVPYAIRAERADKAGGLDDDATGVVRSLNGGQGDLVINGRNGITVQRSGDTIHIESTVTFNGIQNLTSPQNTIQITNPNGPSTQIDVRDGAITTEKLANGAVTNPKLGDGSVTTTKVVDGAITLQKLAPGIIPTTLPPSGPASGDLTGTYPGPVIAPNAVTSAKIADGAVGNADLADNAVTSAKIQDGTVTSSKLTNTGVTAGTYGNTTNIPQVTVDEKGRVTSVINVPLTNFPWVVPAGGDLTGTYPNPLIANNAVTTPKILDGNVTTPKLADGAVTTPKIADNSVTSAKILDGTIQAADLAPGLIPTTLPPSGPAGGELTGTYPNPLIANNAVTSAKIQDGGVTNADLGANSVTTDKIQDGTVQSVDLAPGVIPTTLPPSGTAGGVLSGTYPNPNLATSAGNAVLTAINDGATTMRIADNRLNTTGVAAGTYGNGTTGLVPRITVDQYGRITSAVQEQIQSARPTGNAGGDLQGTYPDPLINPTAAAGGRMVTALSNAFIGGNPAINTAQNLVMLDAANRFPASDGSLITNLNANNITTGVLSVQRGGTGSGATLNNNRMVWTTGNAIVEAPPLAAGQMFIGTGVTTAPAQGTIVAGAGVNVSYSSPNIVISSTDARVAAGTANDQTLRWNAATSQWVNNSNVLASSAGDVTMNGNLVVNGTSALRGNTDIGTNASTVNTFGTGAGATNTIGHSAGTSTTNIRGTVNINHNVDGNTTIGMQSGNTSSIVLAAGVNGNIVMENVDGETPYAFLSLNPSRQVRTALASGMALEGIQWQDGAFRLGGQTALINPLVSTRYINLNNQQLNFTGVNGTRTLINMNGAFPTVNVTATTNINTTGTDLTTIGSPTSKTIIGGELDPRGVIRNQTGAVVVLDEFEQYGQAQINYGTEANTYIGNPTGTGNQNVQIAVGQGASGNLKLINIKNDPLITNVLWLDGSNNVRYQTLDDMDDEGVVFQNHRFRWGAGASQPTPTQVNTFDENRFVNLDQYQVDFTNGSEGAPGTSFLTFDGDNAGAPRITATSLTNINRTGSANTNIGNILSSTDIDGTVTINNDVLGSTVVGMNGNSTSILSSAINVGTGAYASTVNIGTSTNATNNILGTTNVNTTGAATTTIGNTATGGAVSVRSSGVNPITVDVGVNTNNLVLNNIATAANVDDFLRITPGPGNAVRRIPGVNLANEGLMFENGAFRLGHSTDGSNPINTNRFVRINAPGSLTFNTAGNTMISLANSGNVGISTTGTGTTAIGSAAAGAITAQSASTIGITAGTSLTLASVGTFINTGSGNVNVGNTLGTNTVIGSTNVDGATTINDGVNAFTTNIGTGGNTGLVTVGNTANAVSILGATNTITGTTNNITGTTNINTTGSAVTTIGSIATGGAVNVRSSGTNPITLDVGVNTNNLIFNNIATDALPPFLLAMTAANEVRRFPFAGTAQEGIVFTTGAYRLGGTVATENPFLTNRMVNLNTFNLAFTANNNAGNLPLSLTGGANWGVAMTTGGTGTISALGTTNVNTTGSAVTTIGNTATGGAVNVRSSGVNPITVDVGVNTNNLVLNNIATAADVDDFLRITAGPGNAVRRIPGANLANEGLEFENGAFRLGATPDHTINPIVNDRYVGFNGGQLTFATSTGERLMRFTTAGDVEVNGTGNGLTTIGSATAGAIGLQTSTTLTTTSAGNTVVNVTGAGSDLDVNVNDAITLDAATITSTGTTSVSSVAPTVNVNATGTGVTNIGSATAGTIAINAGGAGNDVTINANDDVNVTAVDVNILGTTSTSINTTGTGTTAVGSATAGAITAQSASTIGLTAGTTASIASTTTNINTGSGAVNVGNAAGTNTILGTTNADGNTTINDGASAFTTNIGTAGNTGLVTIGSTSNAVSILGGTNTVTGTTNVNTTGAATTTIGTNGNTADVLASTTNIGTGAYATTVNIGTSTNATNNILGTTNVNTTGSAVTTIGSTATGGAVNVRSSGVNPITVDVGVNTNNLVLNNIATAADADDFLRITPGPGNAVRRLPGANLANEGLEFENGAFRLGATPDHTINPIVNDRYVGFNGGQLTFATSTGERLMRFSTAGDVEVNGTGNGTTTIGSATAGAISAQSVSTIGLTAGTTASIASTTTNINTGSGAVNVGNAAGTNTILGTTNADGNTTINDGASAFTTNIGTGGNTGLVTIGSTSNAVSILGATNTITGTTNINTTGTDITSIGHVAGGVVNIASNGDINVTVTGAGDDLILNGIDNAAVTDDFLRITPGPGNAVRRTTGTALANQGLMFEGGEFRLGHSTDGNNPIITDRFVRVNGPGSLTFNTAANTMISLANSGNVGISTTGTGTTTIGSATAGTIGLQTNSTLTTSSAGNTVIDVTGAGSDLDVNVNDAITLDAATITSTGTTSVSSVAPTVNVNATGTGVTNIGSATAGTIAINAGGAGNDVTINANDDVNVTAVDVNILGTTSTSINTTGTGTTAIGSATAGAITAQSASTIGLTAGTTASIASTTTNINTGSGAVNVGNAAGTNTILGTTNADGNTTINDGASAFTTNIGTGGNTGLVTVGNTSNAVSILGATNTVTGTTNVNTTGAATTTIGSTATGGAVNVRSSGANPITIDVGVNTNNLVLNNILTVSPIQDLLWITAANEVRRAPFSSAANEGLMFENSAFRLGHTTDGSNPIITDRFVRVNGPGSLTFNTGANTMISLANSGNVGISTTGAGTTSIGSAAAGAITAQSASTIGLTAGTTASIASTTTNINTGSGAVNIGNAAGTNTILGTTNADGTTTINDGASAFTTNIGTGGNTGLVTIGSTSNAVSILGATNTITGTTNINTTGTDVTSIGHVAGGAVNIASNGDINVTVTGAGDDLILNGVTTAAVTDDFLRIVPATNEVRRQTGASMANQGLMFEAGEFRLGHSTDGSNPIITDRFVRVNGPGSLTFNTATQTMLSLANTGAVGINTVGNGTTTIGNTVNGGNFVVHTAAGNSASINSTTGNVNIGNGGGTNTITGATNTFTAPTTNINATTLTASVTTGNINSSTLNINSSTNNIGGITNNITGVTNINTAASHNTTIGSNVSSGVVTIASNNDVVIDLGVAPTADVIVNNMKAGAQSNDRVVIDASNQVRRVPNIGQVIYARKAGDETRNGGVAIANDAGLTAAVDAGMTYEFEVYVQYSGSNSPQSSLDLAVTGPVAAATDISYGVVTAGQALAPSNVDGSGSIIANIGTDIVPANRLTVLVKGTIVTNAAGNVVFQWGDNTNDLPGETLTIHRNSYIKLTRVN